MVVVGRLSHPYRCDGVCISVTLTAPYSLHTKPSHCFGFISFDIEQPSCCCLLATAVVGVENFPCMLHATPQVMYFFYTQCFFFFWSFFLDGMSFACLKHTLQHFVDRLRRLPLRCDVQHIASSVKIISSCMHSHNAHSKVVASLLTSCERVCVQRKRLSLNMHFMLDERLKIWIRNKSQILYSWLSWNFNNCYNVYKHIIPQKFLNMQKIYKKIITMEKNTEYPLKKI